jgi:hypothetical protein
MIKTYWLSLGFCPIHELTTVIFFKKINKKEEKYWQGKQKVISLTRYYKNKIKKVL